MSSDQAHLSAVREWAADILRPLLPEDWEIIPYASETLEKLHTVVYITFRTIDHGQGEGDSLPPGQARCEMVVEVTPPQTGQEDSADDGVVQLIAGLYHRHISWARAEKKRPANGMWSWEVTVSVICRITDPTTDEPG
jgi:hypothetical protein